MFTQADLWGPRRPTAVQGPETFTLRALVFLSALTLLRDRQPLRAGELHDRRHFRRHHRDPEGNHRPQPRPVGLTRPFTKSVLSVPDMILAKKLELALSRRSMPGSAAPCSPGASGLWSGKVKAGSAGLGTIQGSRATVSRASSGDADRPASMYQWPYTPGYRRSGA